MLRGESIAMNLAAPAANAFLSHDQLLMVDLAASASRDNQGVVYAALLDGAGQVVGHADPAAMLKPLDFQPSRDLPGVVKHAAVREGRFKDVSVWDLSVPVRLAGGKQVLGSVHVGLAQSVVEGAVLQSLLGLGAISVAILVLGVGLTFWALKVLVRPLREISAASEAVGRGDLSVALGVRSKDEVGRLASNFNAMVKSLKEAEHARLEQGRMEGELSMARAIQSDLLPSRPPFIRGLNVAFNCMPAKELGGDFYDCIEVKGGCWGFLIADVSGKGVPAHGQPAEPFPHLRPRERLAVGDAEEGQRRGPRRHEGRGLRDLDLRRGGPADAGRQDGQRRPRPGLLAAQGQDRDL